MSRSSLLATSLLSLSAIPIHASAQTVPSEILWAAIQSAVPSAPTTPTAPDASDPGPALPVQSERAKRLALGLRMIQASIAAYERSDGARARGARRAGYEVREFLETASDTQALVLEDEKTFVVAIRGSQEARDWVLDVAQASVYGVPGFKVHVGFQAAARSIFPRVNDLASSALLRGKSVWITGHSLGGGIAQLLALMLREQGVTVSGVHTFGSPAVGTAAFATEYDKRLRSVTHRWVNEVDPFPCYPATQQAWEQAGRQHLITVDTLTFDSSATICADEFPTVTRICEGGGRWGAALRWLTGVEGICQTNATATGLLNVIQNLATNEFSAHGSATYEQRIAEELAKE